MECLTAIDSQPLVEEVVSVYCMDIDPSQATDQEISFALPSQYQLADLEVSLFLLFDFIYPLFKAAQGSDKLVWDEASSCRRDLVWPTCQCDQVRVPGPGLYRLEAARRRNASIIIRIIIIESSHHFVNCICMYRRNVF